MKIISGILCVLLIVCSINPINAAKGKTESECILELNIVRFSKGGYLGNSEKKCSKIFEEYFIDRLDSDESKTGYVNSKNGFFVCNDREQIPVIYNIHSETRLVSDRFKTFDEFNGIEVYSCSENKNSGYFTVKCENPN